VSTEELAWMLARLQVRQDLVEAICRDRLDKLTAASKG